jgi:NTP pyrophosphatase (non-canonical NTP hydrolase)
MINSMTARLRNNKIIGLTAFQFRAHEWCVQYRPPEERTVPYILAHTAEELGEVVKDWRKGKLKRKIGKKAGVDHPEGMGSEIADVVIMCCILAEEMGFNLSDDIEVKMQSLEARLDHKMEKKSAKRK